MLAMPDETERKQIFVRPPGKLRARIVADAKKRKLNLNSVVVTILAERYGVEVAVDGSGRPTAPSKERKPIMLRVPAGLDTAIRNAAWTNRRSAQEEIIASLSEHYGLAPVAS